MLKFVASVLIALVSGSSLAFAQTTGVQDRTTGVHHQSTLSPTDLKALPDARVALVKAALQLTPEQEKYWPALEEAIRARSTGRQQRLAVLINRPNQEGDIAPFELLRQRADNMAQRATELKKLVDAWQPLWQTLNPDQKRRVGVPATNRVCGVGRAAGAAHMEIHADDEENWDQGTKRARARPPVLRSRTRRCCTPRRCWDAGAGEAMARRDAARARQSTEPRPT